MIRTQRTTLAALGLLLALPAALARGDDATTQTQPAATSRPASAAELELTPAAIQGKVQEIEAATALDAEVKKKILDSYAQALAKLQAAADWAARTAKLEAPDRLVVAVKDQEAQLATRPAFEAPAGMLLEKAKEELSAAKTELAEVEKSVGDLEDQIKNRPARRQEIPKLIADARKQITAIQGKLDAPAAEGQPPQALKAEQVLLRAQKKALEEEIVCHEKELATYEGFGDLLTAQRALAARCRERLTQKVALLEEVLAKARTDEAARMEAEAREAARKAAYAHPLVRELAEKNLALAERLNGPKGLLALIKQVSDQVQDAQKRAGDMRKEFDSIRDRLNRTGVTHAMAALLKEKRGDLAQLSRSLRAQGSKREEIAAAQLARDELEEERAKMGNVKATVQQILARAEPPRSEWERENLAAAVTDQVESRLKYLDQLTADTDKYFNALVDLETAQVQLRDLTRSLARVVDERILWLQSHPPLGLRALAAVPRDFLSLVRHDDWRSAALALWQDARDLFYLPVLIAACLVAALALRPTVRGRLSRWVETTPQQVRSCSIRPTFKAGLYTLLLSSLGPALLALAPWRLLATAEPGSFAYALAQATLATAGLFLALNILRYACLPNGLGIKHFGWETEGTVLLGQAVGALQYALLPVVFLIALSEASDQQAWQASLGRVAFLVAQAEILVVLWWALRPRVLAERFTDGQSGWVFHSRYLWLPLAAAGVVAVGALVVLGYYYTAVQLSLRVASTLWLVLSILLVYGLVIRWLMLTRRRIAIKRFQERQAAAQAEPKPPAEGAPSPAAEEPKVSLAAISGQTRHLLRAVTGLTFLGGLWVIWRDVLPAMMVFTRQPLWGETVTIAHLFYSLFTVVITVIAARNLPGLLQMVILQRLPIKDDVRFAVATLCRYVITIVGTIVAFGLIGMDWSQIQWLVAAMTVGLGFGLQDIFANFVSGLIILWERPVRVGDLVTVGDVSGTVSQIRMRSTTITDWDCKELIVPNKDIITGRVLNWTLSNRTFRLVFPVGVAYGSDVELVHKLLLRIAGEHPNVLEDPAPQCFFMGFGASSLDFELRAYVNIENGLATRHDLNMTIDRVFRESDIEIAFPQMDLHVKGLEQPLWAPGQAPAAPPRAADDSGRTGGA